MKELTIEQKAKAYDEILERAEAVIKEAKNQKEVYGCITTIFPELKESEDERIRKMLRAYIHDFGVPKEYFEDIEISDVLAWLEKQAEKKQTWEPDEAQLIVIKDLIEDKNTSKVNKVILRGMLDEFKQYFGL